jgi:multidrug efflux pump subunit AcrB
MPKDVSVETTEKILRHIEQAGYKTRDEFVKKYPKAKGKIIKHIFTIIGSQPAKNHGPGAKGTSTIDSSKAEVEIEIMSSEVRPFTATEFLNRWRENVGEIPEAESLTFQSNLMSAGSDIAYEFSASSFKNLQKAVKKFKNILKKYPAVYNIQDDFEVGKKEIQILLKPSAATYGIRLFDLASQVRQAFYGGEALRMQRNRDEVKVIVNQRVRPYDVRIK